MGCPDKVRGAHCLRVWGGLKKRKKRQVNLWVTSFLSVGLSAVNLAKEVLIRRSVQHSFFLAFLHVPNYNYKESQELQRNLQCLHMAAEKYFTMLHDSHYSSFYTPAR